MRKSRGDLVSLCRAVRARRERAAARGWGPRRRARQGRGQNPNARLNHLTSVRHQSSPVAALIVQRRCQQMIVHRLKPRDATQLKNLAAAANELGLRVDTDGANAVWFWFGNSRSISE